MAGRSYRGIPPRKGIGSGLHKGWRPEPPPALVPDTVYQSFFEPFRGITTDGNVVPNLFAIAPTGVSTGAIAQATRDYITTLSAAERSAGVLPVKSQGWREWTNAFPRWTPHGILLEDMTETQRHGALAVINATLSARGYEQTRNVMILNEALGELIDDLRDSLTQWIYWFTIFGEPSTTEPWGWQVVGHHLDLHCFVLGDQLVMTPMFMGAEFCVADDGPFAGTSALLKEREDALSFIHSLTTEQYDTAVLYRSILTKDLPPELDYRGEGRMRAGQGQDNSVIPYEGLPTRYLDNEQRGLLVNLITTYAGQIRDEHAAIRMDEILRHFDETHFAWMGGSEENDAFYYKIHNPVVLIEFDSHRGSFLAAEEPLPYHSHFVVRTPNGNDYGKDLLAQHYAQFAH